METINTVMVCKRLMQSLTGIVAVISSLCFLGGNAYPESESQPPNVRLTTAAWEFYNAEKYDEAIKSAEKCIDDFQASAWVEQEALEKSKAPMPPVGKVGEEVSQGDKETILNRGVLNDVAACWFIKGRSLEKLKREKEAISAYQEAAKYTYARAWDPSWNGFWSPAKSAGDNASFLGKNMQ
jgi:tetratricopeptide (TPR) repeat protein